jgi:hypothetical protein
MKTAVPSPTYSCTGIRTPSTPSAIDRQRRAMGWAWTRFFTRYQAEIPPTNQAALISTASSMCGKRWAKAGLNRMLIQSLAWNWPATFS